MSKYLTVTLRTAAMLIAFTGIDGARAATSLWDHNGSTVYLVPDGTTRKFHYHEPRPAMREAGARSGSLLFTGSSINGRYHGTAYIFNRECGQIPYTVSGPILDNDLRVVLTGHAPRVDANCRVMGYFTDTLEFSYLKSVRIIAPNDIEPALKQVQGILNHNGSIMRFNANPATGTFSIVYAQPRPGLAAIGVMPGVLLIKGQMAPWFTPIRPIHAVAHTYNPNCGAMPYSVVGRWEGDTLILEGPAPVVWAGTCIIAEYVWTQNSYLRFDILEPIRPL